MVTSFNNLQKLTIGHLELYYESESTTGGKKIVVHDYANKDTKDFEELGIAPPKFSITAIAAETLIGGEISLYDYRVQVENALNGKGKLTLKHPIYGEIDVMVMGHSTSTSQTEVGIVRFTIEVEKSDRITIVQGPRTPPTPNEVFKPKDQSLIQETQNIIDDGGKTELVKNLTFVEELIKDVNDFLAKANKKTQAITDRIANVNKTITDIRQVANNATSSLAVAKDSLVSLYSGIMNIVQLPSDLEIFWKGLIDYRIFSKGLAFLMDDNETRLTPGGFLDGSKEISNYKSSEFFIESAEVMALVQLPASWVDKEYKTDDEIELDKIFYNEKFSEIVENIRTKYTDEQLVVYTPLVSIASVREILNQAKVAANEILNEKKQITWQVGDQKPGLSSMSLICFENYGNLDNIEIISNLNPVINYSGFNSEIKILMP